MKKLSKYYKTNTSHYAKCRTWMLRLKHMHRIRFFLTSVILFANCYFHVITLPILYYGDIDRISALLWGSFAFLINLVILLTAFFAEAKKLKLILMLLVLILVSSVIRFLHLYAGIALGLLFLSQIPECMKMRWLERQQGYPYFNERYQQQIDLKRMTSEFMDNSDDSENQMPKPKFRYDDIVVFSMPKEKNK
ncbi:MAG: hypothetical protein IJJ69_11455 [Oscillospiraceae bacterium]|nr:hypothetical protein [Oscillospiraceae bacterium]